MEKKKFKITYGATDAEDNEVRCVMHGRPMILNVQILYDSTIDLPFEVTPDMLSKQ